MNLWGVQLGMRNSGSKISEFLKTPQVFGMSHAGQASAQAQKCPHLHRLLTKAFPTSKDFTTKCLSPLSWFSLPGWILIFFSLSSIVSVPADGGAPMCWTHPKWDLCPWQGFGAVSSLQLWLPEFTSRLSPPTPAVFSYKIQSRCLLSALRLWHRNVFVP